MVHAIQKSIAGKVYRSFVMATFILFHGMDISRTADVPCPDGYDAGAVLPADAHNGAPVAVSSLFSVNYVQTRILPALVW